MGCLRKWWAIATGCLHDPTTVVGAVRCRLRWTRCSSMSTWLRCISTNILNTRRNCWCAALEAYEPTL